MVDQAVAVDRTIGFVDLVGFTATSRTASLEEVDRLLERFERAAVSAAGGRARVVKVIGDAVMLAAETADAAVAATVRLVDACATDAHLPAARGGVSTGRVLARGDDYAGPAVNRAARLAELAAPGTVLADGETRAAAGASDLGWHALGSLINGDIGEVVLWQPVRPERIQRIRARDRWPCARWKAAWRGSRPQTAPRGV